MPLATGLIFDVVIPSVMKPQLAFLALGLLVAAFASVAFNLTRGIALLRIEARSDAAIQGAVWDRLLSLPLPFFRPYTAGDLAVRANGINAIRQILSGAVITTLLSGFFSLFNFGLLFYYSLNLALVATVLVLLNVGITLSGQSAECASPTSVMREAEAESPARFCNSLPAFPNCGWREPSHRRARFGPRPSENRRSSISGSAPWITGVRSLMKPFRSSP